LSKATKFKRQKEYPHLTVKITTLAIFLWALVFIPSPCFADTGEPGVNTDLSALVRSEGVDPDTSALLVVRLQDGEQWTSGGERIDQRYPPASTSKIPHTLIALETGFAEGPDTVFEWDGKERTFDFWNRDQTLLSAYRFSAVWVYQCMTQTLGYETMSKWIGRLDYGNASIGTPDDLTTYWLLGPLETTAREQIEFLTRLATDDLPFSADTLQTGKQVMQADQGEDWVLYAKTGWRADGQNVDIGWYVGWLEQDRGSGQETYVFAFNMDLVTADDRERRKTVVRAALIHLGLMTQ
jgi:beta-lactamase class D